MTPTFMGISCLCGAVAQRISPRRTDFKVKEISIDHSDTDRHATEYVGADRFARYFCRKCGCHVFRCKGVGDHAEWEAATGVLVDSTGDDAESHARFTVHTSVSDTKDGGISSWLAEVDGRTLATAQRPEPSVERQAVSSLPPLSPLVPAGSLPASCACGTVSFHITRPNERSHLPHSGFPDLLYPACKHSEEFMKNPDRVKWWVRADGTKYLAGTCACRPCRLASGFEVQTWAFVPRENVFLHAPGPGGRRAVFPLDFAAPPAGALLRTYESSPGVLREFCGGCGATVFWHDIWRPDVIDVSAGLLRAPEGARADTWLDWWTGRCSFAEEADKGRTGEPARMARKLIDGLEGGLRSREQSS
ncbi:glutathione-dependent formaldehyde-activating enzyme [Colletotrichum zoysiae]|uniref:Glutathione-dependent formaldehyde-activating enzyme n=1 Tax=Colletotrichum zoysiae TaxID=1216348 RepID=A0AAD9HL07_9PEZI|nr:glutathione-dependent formaldehyde-activating enzyme [Colletotrichum zoysiae]